jgi:hypothetical protein
MPNHAAESFTEGNDMAISAQTIKTRLEKLEARNPASRGGMIAMCSGGADMQDELADALLALGFDVSDDRNTCICLVPMGVPDHPIRIDRIFHKGKPSKVEAE